MSDCGPGRYLDTVVGRCADCHDICNPWTFQDMTSDCHRFCPNYKIGGGVPSPPNHLTTTDVLPYVLLAVAIVTGLLGFLVWHLRRRRSTSRDIETTQGSGPCQENTPIQEEGPEVGFSDLHTPPIDHQSERLLTTTSV